MLFDALDLRDATAVCAALRAGAEANRKAACRRGSIDAISAPGRLIATGDLHDNPLFLARLVRAAGMEEAGAVPASHLLVHEIIHPHHLLGGLDMSHRALTRVAMLKATFPEHVHALLGNHELAQAFGQQVVKDGVRCLEAFEAGVEQVFGEKSPGVLAAIGEFVRSMPLALRCACGDGKAILCAHSLPASMASFDAGVLERTLADEDYAPRRGAAHQMVWGRGSDAGVMAELARRWGVDLFVLGHEHVEEGARFVAPCAVILNSDHERGVYWPVDLAALPEARRVADQAVRLAENT